MNKYYTKKDFENWRDDQIGYYNQLCKYNYLGIISDDFMYYYNLRMVPRCLVHLTKRMCNCENDCIILSMRRRIFDPICKFYDLKNLYLHDRYIDCSFLNKRLPPDDSIHKYFNKLPMNSSNILYDGINSICKGDEEVFNKLQCTIYDIRFNCQYSEECYQFVYNQNAPSNCVNPEFENNMYELERINGFPFLYNFTVNNIYTGHINSSISKRSISKDIDFFNASTLVKYNTLNLIF